VAAKSEGAAQAIAEIEGIAERGAAWVGENLVLVGVLVAALLASAAGVGVYFSNRTAAAEAGSDALDNVHAAYLKAMGANAGAIDVPELANPTAAAAIREEFLTKFGEVADEYPGTVAGVLARLEQGNLSEAGGELEDSVTIWREMLTGLSGNPKLEAIVHQRIGQAYEDADQWLEAAESHEAASAIETNPLRYFAMADAARCYSQAGETERAKVLAERLHLEAPTLELPGQLSASLRELRTAR
jgi:hypothetical protein